MKQRISIRVIAMLVALILAAVAAQANVRLPAVFGNNAVLQRNAAIPVWGWADDGEKVTVSIQGKSVSATAQGGKWRVDLPALEAGGPFEMIVEGKNKIALQNVLVGEVWVCSGQSNMDFTLNKAHNAAEAMAASTDPQLRFFKVPRVGADEPTDDVKAKWEESNPGTCPNVTAVGYFFARDLRKALNVPVGIIHSAYGGTNAWSWTSRATLESQFKSIMDGYNKAVADFPKANEKHQQAVAAWKQKLEEIKKSGRKPTAQEARSPQPPMGPNNPKRPAALYNGMIKPLQPFAIRGAIWYQGESNAGSEASAKQYADLFPAMIADWRKDWGQGDFPFYFVQLASYGTKDNEWALLRETQFQTLAKSPNTGMAVTIDVGDPKDIHPTDKQTVGERLARIARVKDYGEKMEISGPVFQSMETGGGKAVLTFDHAASGLEAKGGDLKDFQAAGADGKFVPAKAAIDGAKVVVTADGVADIQAVRYGWKASTECNLYNKDGLPAVPFRTNAK